MPASSILWLNGHLVPLADARISPLDHGFLVGDGVFETLVARDGKAFAARRHWERLTHSCQEMGLMPMPYDTYLTALQDTLDANGLLEARLRVTMSSGEGPLGSGRGNGHGTVVIVATALLGWPPTERVVLAPWTRNERGALAGVKSLSYAENVRALAYAKARGCGEALVANTRGELCEGTGSNLFVMQQGRLLTPPLQSGCLAGITRALVWEACRKAGIECVEHVIPATELHECDEAFLTSSTRNVHPIAEIDGRKLAMVDGELTRRVQAAYTAYCAALSED